MTIFHHLTQLLLTFFRHYPLPTILVLLTFEEAGIPLPLPGDTLLVLAGIQHGHDLVFSLGVITVASIAVFIGSTILYFVMQRGGRPLVAKYGKVLHISEKRLNQVESWFVQRGTMGVIAGRLIPGLRIPTTIFAGLSGMPYRQFAVATAIASVIWSVIYLLLGVVVGRSYSLIVSRIVGVLDNIPRALLILFAFIFVGLLIGSMLHIRGRRQRAADRAAGG